MRILKLKLDLPFLKKGSIFGFEDDTRLIFAFNLNYGPAPYPLRPGLSGYLWLLSTEGRKYLTPVTPNKGA